MNRPHSPQKTLSGSNGKSSRADNLCNHETKQKKAKVAINDESEEKLRATAGVSIQPHEASSESQKKPAAATYIPVNTNTAGNTKTTGTDEDMNRPEIVQMQEALELIPDKEAYLEAQRRVPFLVATESPPLRFLRREDFDPSAAAKRLVLYWKKRKDIFGKRAFLPLDLSGNGALGAEDIIVVNTKFIALLPPDQDNRPCFYYDRLPMKDGSLYSSESRNRAIFYWFQVLSESEAAQTDGVACLNVVPDNHFTESNRGNVMATLDLIKNAVPVRVHSAHLIFQPPVGRKRTFTETIIPSTMKMVGTFFWRAMKFHMADTKEEMCQKLQEHRFTKAGIPVSLGGSWEYDQVEDWKMERKPIEKKHHEEFLAQGSSLSLDQESKETSTFQETESVKEKALAELEGALELISDESKAALMEARQRMPDTVNKEADPIRFLRLENYNTWAAARRLVTYWSTRIKLFGDRAFLPMNQTGEGTLNRFDIAALCTGYMVFLPNDMCGRSVCYCDTSKIASQSAETRMRVAFYMVSIACENDMTQKDGMVFVNLFSQPRLDKTSRKIGEFVHDALPAHIHLLHVVNGWDLRSKKTYTEILLPSLLKMVTDLFGQQTVVHVADSGAELGKKLEGYDFAIKHLPKGLGGTWDYDKFAQWQDQRMRYEWEIPAGTGHKDSGYVLEYTVTPFSELTEEEKAERKRRMNVLHSRRKRERRKVEAEVFHDQVAELEQSNDALRADSRHLEELLEEANAMVARIEGLRHSAEMAHASTAVNTMPSASSNVADLIRARQSLAQQQLIQQALTQQSLVQPPFTSHGGLASSSGAVERQFLNQGIQDTIRETHVGSASRGTFGQQLGQGQHFPDESNHLTDSAFHTATAHMRSDPAATAASRFAHMGSDPAAMASSRFAHMGSDPAAMPSSRFAYPATSLYPTGPDRLEPPSHLNDAIAAALLGYNAQATPSRPNPPQPNPGLLSNLLDFSAWTTGAPAPSAVNNGQRYLPDNDDSSHPRINNRWGGG
jgi:hypothetical protein